MIYFGSPAFFVEASDSLMLDRRQRILQSFAGPFAELVLAGFSSLAFGATPRRRLLPAPLQVRVDQLLRDLPEPDPAT